MGRLSLGLGLGIGYVLGAQAGRARYEQIKQAAAGVMERPEVQQALERARTAAPAPLQGSIAKLSGRGSAGQGSAGQGSAGQGSAGPGSGAGTADVEAVILEQVGAPETAPQTSDATGSGTHAAVPDPLIPPAKSGPDSTG